MKSPNSKCPIKHNNIYVKRFNSSWLSDSILNSIKEKHRLYSLSLTNPSQLPTFRRYRNILTDTIRKAKATYYQAKFRSCSSDGRATWKVINSVLPTKKSGPDQYKLLINDSEESDSKILSETFNHHFSNVASVLADNIPDVNFDPLTHVNRLNNTFVLQDVTVEELFKTIKSFRPKMSSITTIPNFIYNHVCDIIAPILVKLFNSSVRQGIFPNRFKLAHVIPLFQSGSKLLLANYRPISLLPFLSKVLEKFIHSRMSAFLNKYNVLFQTNMGLGEGNQLQMQF